MKAISVRQPWADAIVWHGKTIENRTWNTGYRGPLLIHAAKLPDPAMDDAMEFIARASGQFSPNSLPAAEHFGGIIARATLVDVVTSSTSPWFVGPFGFVLADVERLPFRACRGALNLFNVEEL
jgi:hypothetical protein